MNTLFTARIGRFLAVATLMVSSVLLSGCGGDDAPAVVTPKGYYINSSTTVKADNDTDDLALTDMQAMVHDGRIILMSASTGLLYDGTYTTTGNTISATFTIYRDGALLLSSVAMSGSFRTASSITGTLSGTGAGNGTFSLSYANTNNQAASISRIQRTLPQTWGAIVGGGTSAFEMTISSTGKVLDDVSDVGGLFNNCVIGQSGNLVGGQITPVAGTNLYTVNGLLASCSIINVRMDYTGLATTRSAVNTDDTLVFVMTSGSYSFNGEFQKFAP